MAKILTEPELQEIVAAGEIIENGLDESVEGIKYDFHMGTQILMAGARQLDTEKLSEAERAELALEPGEMAFALSQERLNLPNDIKVELSHKRKLSHCGILIGGGFCVDPLYKGWLVLLLYNFSSTRFPLRPGNKIIAGMFYRLEANEVSEVRKEPDPINAFPDEVVALMREYSPFSPEQFDETIEGLKKRFSKLEETIREGERWRNEFREGLRELKESVTELTSDLKMEQQIRKGTDEELERRQESVESTLEKIRAAVTVSKVYWAILGAVALAALTAFFGYVFGLL